MGFVLRVMSRSGLSRRLYVLPYRTKMGIMFARKIALEVCDWESPTKKESGRRYRGDAHVGVLRMLLLG